MTERFGWNERARPDGGSGGSLELGQTWFSFLFIPAQNPEKSEDVYISDNDIGMTLKERSDDALRVHFPRIPQSFLDSHCAHSTQGNFSPKQLHHRKRSRRPH